MFVHLQDSVSYQNHFSWALSQAAYHASGLDNWISGDVPAFMTGNAALAQQKAEILFRALNLRPHHKACSPKDDKTISVLELGAGNGLFAWHFIRVFQNLNQSRINPYVLRYFLSDAQTTGLKSLLAIPAFKPLIQSKTLILCQATLFKAGQLQDLNGENLKTPEIDLIICNYLFCNLPFRLLRWHNNQCEEAYISTSLRLNNKNINKDLQTEMLQHIKELLQSLKPERGKQVEAINNELSQIKPNLWKHFIHTHSRHHVALPGKTKQEQLWWQEQLQSCSEEWLPCQIEALKCLKLWTEPLKPGGVLMISDKGRTQSEGFVNPPTPYGHGLHASWPIHFPLLAHSLETQSLKVSYTKNHLWTFHTLLAYKNDTDQDLLFKSFKQGFEEHNANQFAADLIDSAEDYWGQENWRKAAILYQQALIYRPKDARITYQLILCLLELQAFDQAAIALEKPVHDPYSLYDFAYQKGQVALFNGDYQQACQSFQESLDLFGSNASVYYNLGLTQIMLSNHSEAKQLFKAALLEDPDYEIARSALTIWSETL